MRRELRESDFDDYADEKGLVKTIYVGDSNKYLNEKESYIVRKSSIHNDKVVVLLQRGQGLLTKVIFPMNYFEIEIEDDIKDKKVITTVNKKETEKKDKKSIKTATKITTKSSKVKQITLDDLSPEDRESLLNQAREVIEQENIEKNAIAMYTIKKKEYLESIISEVDTELNIKECKDKTYIGERMKSLIYSLFRYDKYGNHYNGQKTNTISCAKEWESFTKIGDTVKAAVIKSVKDDNS